jgi:RNA polymerase sigma-70 factor (ECF subfamily)
VAAAGDPAAANARAALEYLCGAYWYPLYAFARRQGLGPEAAADAVQGLFAELLDRNALAAAEPRRGRFRTFLLAACRHSLANQRRHDRARKRGGGRRTLTIDAAAGECRYHAEPVDDLTPERLYQRAWALELLARVLGALRREYEGNGKAALFSRLEPSLAGRPDAETYAAIAAALGMSEGAVQVAAHRLRGRYRALIRAEIAATVREPDEVEDEIRALFTAFEG